MSWSRQLLERIKSSESSENDDLKHRRWEYWAQPHSKQESEDIDLSQRYEIARHKIDRQFEIVRKEQSKVINLLRITTVVVGLFSAFLGAVAGFTIQEPIPKIESQIEAIIVIIIVIIAVFSITYAFIFLIVLPFEALSILSPEQLSNPILLLWNFFGSNTTNSNEDASSMLQSGPHDLDQNQTLLEQYQICINHNNKIIEGQRRDLHEFYRNIKMIYFLALVPIFLIVILILLQ